MGTYAVLYDKLARQLEMLQDLLQKDPFGKEYNAWNAHTKSIIQSLFGSDSLEAQDFCLAGFAPGKNSIPPEEKYRQTLRAKQSVLQTLLSARANR
ncbi:MAG TPA: hypothetical protein DCL13_04320 [Peptococcaceae bacterium]|nr:hypothetical protein [Peptococcaceae bacterium]